MEETKFFTVRKGSDLVVINKNARYQLGLIHVTDDGDYSVDGDSKVYRHVNNALGSLIRLASKVD